MPKVLRIINRLNLGGPTYNAAYLSKYMAPEFETLLVAGMKDESEASSAFITDSLGLKPVYIKNMHRSLNPIQDIKAYKEIVKIIREFKPDIVHTHAAKSGALGRLAAINEGVPVILHTFHGHIFHSYFNSLKTKLFLKIERYLSRKSSKIIAISQKQFEELCYDFNIDKPEKFEIVPLGFDLQRFHEGKEEKRKGFREKYNLSEEDIAIGIIGRLVPVKNHSFFLKAISKLKEQTNKRVIGVIIGDGELKDDIFAEAQKLNLQIDAIKKPKTDIIFTSWIKDVDFALPGLEIVALTSLNEGTPVSLIEAQAAGIPIVSTRVGGIEDVVKVGETAFLSDKDDVVTFSNHLLNLVENVEIRNSFSIKGLEVVENKYHYMRLVNDMKDLYSILLSANLKTNNKH
jgi:glycosyltransferase involved in cell wall biosynthesis